jgi:hypothetical protein
VTTHPYILAFASPDAPLDVRWIPGNGAGLYHLIVASRVLALEGDSTYRLNVSVFAQGGGLVIDGRELPGTYTLAMVTIPPDGGASLDASAGVPPSADFLWIASFLCDVRARYMKGRQVAEEDMRAASLAPPSLGRVRT